MQLKEQGHNVQLNVSTRDLCPSLTPLLGPTGQAKAPVSAAGAPNIPLFIYTNFDISPQIYNLDKRKCQLSRSCRLFCVCYEEG